MNRKRTKRVSKLAKTKSDRSVVEAFRNIRTNFIFATSKNAGCKKVLFSSALPRDGKSTSCANLAVSLAQTGAKVLVIDCDMRKPRIHRFFNCENVPGLSNVLAGFNQITECVTATTYENLYILPSGIIPPNPAELIQSPNMKNLIDGLEKTFDFILFDSPPINYVSDALLLTKLTDGVILIAKQGVTPHPELIKAIKSLEFVDADILGIILNETFEEKTSRYRKYNYYGYYDYYEDTETEEQNTSDTAE
ncbi:MAG: CpsD/CapB family tyrosine-protein kinase [Clostridia bacterium]|nr:CpsD/CapB family tyrosine-protein kinase [Clostridia bacterium]